MLTPHTAIMPKAGSSSQNTVVARNETTSLYERISLSSATRKRYAHIGFTKRKEVPKVQKPVSHPVTEERNQELRRQAQEAIAKNSLLHRMVMSGRKLEDRIMDPVPHLELIEELYKKRYERSHPKHKEPPKHI